MSEKTDVIYQLCDSDVFDSVEIMKGCVVVFGCPGDDSDHNCDAMGCGSVAGHVLAFRKIVHDPDSLAARYIALGKAEDTVHYAMQHGGDVYEKIEARTVALEALHAHPDYQPEPTNG